MILKFFDVVEQVMLHDEDLKQLQLMRLLLDQEMVVLLLMMYWVKLMVYMENQMIYLINHDHLYQMKINLIDDVLVNENQR